jgi:hypothetical protein
MNTTFKILAAVLTLTMSGLAFTQSIPVAGTIVSITGQRAQVQLADGTKRWFSIRKTDAALTPANVGKKISGTATHVGDADMLGHVSIANH